MRTATARDYNIRCEVTDRDIAQYFSYNIGTAIRAITAATTDAKHQAQHLAQARTHLRLELCRQSNLKADDAIIDCPDALDMRPFAKVALIATSDPLLVCLFKPQAVKDIRSMGRISRRDVCDVIDSIDMLLTSKEDE